MTVTTRPATAADAPEMCAILNEIIAIGGTSAHEDAYSEADMTQQYVTDPSLIGATVAEIDGAIVGFQGLWRVDPSFDGPGAPASDWADIASFVKVGITGQGIGKALFTATKQAARAANVAAIDAKIRADNAGGLRFYGAMGFVDYAVVKDVPLKDGTPVDRIRKVYRLQSA